MFDENFDDLDNENATDASKEENTPDNPDSSASEKISDKSSKNEDTSSINSDLIRGHINTIILRALYERDKYGYEIIADIEKKSHGQYTLKQPTLYSALKRLENQGYIKAYWKTDEVSSGGRRKYFMLTESGKEVTETNLAEWEYSRTIIDNLISDKPFDFNRPAPTPVDMTILRDSVSRTPIVKTEEAQTEQPLEPEDQVVIWQSVVQESPTESKNQQLLIDENAKYEEQPATEAEEKTVDKPVTKQETVELTEEQLRIAEQRRIAHENYLRLISAPVKEPPPAPQHEDIVPNSENINADSLLYNNRPEPERDYKNLVDGIFNKAMYNGSVQTSYVKRQPTQTTTVTRKRPVVTDSISDKGRSDGISVFVSSDDIHSTYATKTTYDKGLTLFKCSAIIFAILAIEFIVCAILKDTLKIDWGYPVIILLVGVVQFTIFGVLALQKYGQNSVRPTTNTYLSISVILSIILILIICAVSFLLNMNASLASDIFKMIIIPSFTVLNIPFFALFFKLFTR